MSPSTQISRTSACARDLQINVGSVERVLSAVGGATLATVGLLRGRASGLGLAALGGGLLYRGLTGHCHLYCALAIDTSKWDENAAGVVHRGTRIDETIVVQRAASELFALWRDFSGLPRFLKHIESVTTMGSSRSRWTAKGPLGASVTWDAEIYRERPHELIAFRSLKGSPVEMAGSIRFVELAPDATEIRVQISYIPLGGKLGAAAAGIFGNSLVSDDIRGFKEFAEGRLRG